MNQSDMINLASIMVFAWTIHRTRIYHLIPACLLWILAMLAGREIAHLLPLPPTKTILSITTVHLSSAALFVASVIIFVCNWLVARRQKLDYRLDPSLCNGDVSQVCHNIDGMIRQQPNTIILGSWNSFDASNRCLSALVYEKSEWTKLDFIVQEGRGGHTSVRVLACGVALIGSRWVHLGKHADYQDTDFRPSKPTNISHFTSVLALR